MERVTVYAAHWSRYDDWVFVGVFSEANRAKIAADEHGRREWLEILRLFADEPENLFDYFKQGPTPGGVTECKMNQAVQWRG